MVSCNSHKQESIIDDLLNVDEGIYTVWSVLYQIIMCQIFFIFKIFNSFLLFDILCFYTLRVNSHLFSKNVYKKNQYSYSNNGTTFNGINNNELKRNGFMHLSNGDDTLTVFK